MSNCSVWTGQLSLHADWTMASGFSMWRSPNESPQTGACLQHLQGGCAGGGLEKVRVLALCREACPDCCCLAKTAPEKQKTDDGERGEPKGWLVCSFCSVSVFTLEGVSIGYGYHIVHDITHVAAWCDPSICPAFLLIVSWLRLNTCCKIQ